MAGGRPTIYTPELVDYILSKIETCDTGLRKLCSGDDRMPNYDTILEWRSKHEQFSERYLNSRRKQAHILSEQTKDIAEETINYAYEDPKTGAICIDSGIVAMQKMRISTNTWLASRINPKEYGDKQQTEHSVSDSTKEVVKRVADINKEAEKEY